MVPFQQAHRRVSKVYPRQSSVEMEIKATDAEIVCFLLHMISQVSKASTLAGCIIRGRLYRRWDADDRVVQRRILTE